MTSCFTLLNIISNFSYLFYWFPFGSSIPQSIRLEINMVGQNDLSIQPKLTIFVEFLIISSVISLNFCHLTSTPTSSMAWTTTGFILEIGFVPVLIASYPFGAYYLKKPSHLTSSCIFHTDKKNRSLLSCFRLCSKRFLLFSNSLLLLPQCYWFSSYHQLCYRFLLGHIVSLPVFQDFEILLF